MTARRVKISNIATQGEKPVADITGLSGEEFESEIYNQYGLSVNPEDAGESILIEQNGDADNYIALPPSGKRIAEKGTVLVYYGDDVDATFSKDCIILRVGNTNFTVKEGEITTNADIITTGDVVADGISLIEHRHAHGSGPGVTDEPE